MHGFSRPSLCQLLPGAFLVSSRGEVVMINLWASKSREPGQGCTLRGSLPAPGSLPAGQVPRQGRASEPPWGPQTPSKGLASAQGSPPATALFFPWKLALRCWGHGRRGRRPGQPHPSGVSKEHCLSLSELHHSLLRKEAWGPRDRAIFYYSKLKESNS